uniref:Putative chaperone n=1 Tax=viral metagenome TaxID=1070528 RepID=A0A6M3JN31_9ZZZZ
MAYQKCPVCNGNGIVSGGFYSHPGDYPYWTTDHTTEQCRTCQGKGVIVDEIKTWQDSTVKKD